jgi:hypothetical protein
LNKARRMRSGKLTIRIIVDLRNYVTNKKLSVNTVRMVF